MNFYQQTNRYLTILIILDVLLAALITFLFFGLRATQSVQIEELDKKLVVLENLRRQTDAVGKMIRDNRQTIDELGLYFITKGTTVNFIEELESLASRVGVSIKLDSLNVMKDEKLANKPSFLRVKLRFDGNFSNVFRFLTIMENLPYKVRFNSVNLSSALSWRGDVDFDLISYSEK